MGDYVSKQKLLEWLESQYQPVMGFEEWNTTVLKVQEKIQSGAFDADESEGTWKATAEVLGRENAQMNSELQRLRAALVEIKQLLNENRENDGAFQSWNHMQAWKVATQALSITTELTKAAKVEWEGKEDECSSYSTDCRGGKVV